MKRTSKKQRPGPAHPRRAVVLAAAAVLICAAALALFFLTRPAHLDLPYLTAGNIAVLDLNTGRFVYEKESDDPRSPASLTKLMTLLLVLDDVECGALDWDTEYRVTPADANTPGSKYGMRAGETFTVRELVAGTVLCSGCDCVQCLVKLSAGDEAAFVRRMNDKAAELDLTGTRFVNATGIDASGHYMTAQNIAELASALVTEHPEILEFTSQPTLELGERTFRNMHRLVGRDPRVLGLKTGTTQVGGYNLVTYAQEGDDRYIIVLLDSNNDATRFSETETVVDALFPEGAA